MTELSRFKEVLISLLIVAVALIGYFIGGRVWLNSEKEIDNKIFGAYRVSTIDNSPDIGETSAEVLSVELLIKALNDNNENSEVRAAAAEALGKIYNNYSPKEKISTEK